MHTAATTRTYVSSTRHRAECRRVGGDVGVSVGIGVGVGDEYVQKDG